MKTAAQLTAVAIFWAGVFHVGHWTMDEMEPMTTAFLRFTVAAITLWPLLVWMEPKDWRVRRGEVLPLIGLGCTGIFLYNAGFFYGLEGSGPVTASVVIASIPMVTALLSALILKETFTGRQAVGLVLSFAGVFLVVTEGRWELAGWKGGGIAWLTLAVFSFSFYTILGRRWMVGITPLKATAYATAWGAVGLGIAAFFTGGWFPEQSSLGSWLGIGYMAWFATVWGFVWWNKGVARWGAGRTAVFLNMVPLFTLLITVVTGEVPTLFQITGTCLVVAGVSLATIRWSEQTVPLAAKETQKSGS
ncbi:DMT family transporter [Desmospora profundinema]|uniref:Drug/metabolite transporter (DMT)-like permease n=1 Tax=Desmospora profundinema TaxID=1571184 RepID=A0ABU1IJM6_9BACL|nr:EamA family transporter [Desmospora profundinema]MDR6224598.1 drug/metabolite transporter (DMT)-like permease [Desmospora profundinema]